jgi:hypothetical protein
MQRQLPWSLARAASEQGESRIVKGIRQGRMSGSANWLLFPAKGHRPEMPDSGHLQHIYKSAPGEAGARKGNFKLHKFREPVFPGLPR